MKTVTRKRKLLMFGALMALVLALIVPPVGASASDGEVATVHVTLWNDDNQNGTFDGGEEITTDEDGAIKVEVSNVGQLVTCNTIHLPPGTEISYRLLRGGIYGPWQKMTFSAGYTDWQAA